MIDWSQIKTVFLDMDGTLLDLHFDNYFWQQHVPQRYAERHGLTVQQAKDALYPRFRVKEGTIDWYCIDHWTRELGLDIALLKAEVDHLIAVHPYVIAFLDEVRHSGRRIVLVTNAHFKALELKMERTRLAGHFDRLICAHNFGMPKEQDGFWERLQVVEPFDPAATLLVDDGVPILRAAQRYGIRHLLAVYHPDSRGPRKDVGEFPAIRYFKDVMPVPALV